MSNQYEGEVIAAVIDIFVATLGKNQITGLISL